MNRIKYIVVRKEGLERPYLFGELDTHREVAVAMLHPYIDWNASNPFSPVVGAGFCERAEDGRWQCFGESTSLKVKSRGRLDESVLNEYLGG
jgi:hypothetical protein